MDSFVIAKTSGNPLELIQAAADPSIEVKCALAANPNTPESVLCGLAQIKDEQVIVALSTNPTYKKWLCEAT